ncbi:RNA polymerase sigma factor [Paraglaciecola arctica]|uniref:RNA polymerase sigma factor n=1 Tax=Paraglaciecola arctica TaxID=1128911 RepID=UPI001C0665AC|nr:sigma-70 family RNA polymerase sigma factor [Paraglaciecola arctica]MBU3005026.1 sigma-70 family RNA polymerase sigma factor [Paraglaciecola arctica]
MNTAAHSTLSLQDQSLFNDVELAQDGDQQAFGRLINQTRNLVTSIALSIVKDLDNSEDVAQQVYIGAWQNMSELKSSSSFLPWLRQMTRYKALNFLRDNKTRQKVAGEEADLILSQFCDPKLDVDSKIEREQSNVILEDFISQLPEESREIVLLYYREEQSSKQVAHLLEQSEANIRKKLSRVRQLLHEQILRKHGKLLLSTAPALGFSSLILGAITTSTPVAAAAMSSAAAGSKSGMLHKLGLLLGGSMIGALLGILAVRVSTSHLLKKVSSEEVKAKILNYRKTVTIWLIVSGLMLLASYELTTGWWAPVTAYLLFASVLFYLVTRLRMVVTNEICQAESTTTKQKNMRLRLDICYWCGLVLGFGGGFVGMISGLINSGRLLL